MTKILSWLACLNFQNDKDYWKKFHVDIMHIKLKFLFEQAQTYDEHAATNLTPWNLAHDLVYHVDRPLN